MILEIVIYDFIVFGVLNLSEDLNKKVILKCLFSIASLPKFIAMRPWPAQYETELCRAWVGMWWLYL